MNYLLKRSQKTKLKKLKNECEKLMYEIALEFYGKKCEYCGSDKKIIIHHFIPRSKCRMMIYHPDNWIILCRSCHFDLHKKQNSLIIAKIIEKRGEKWLKRLEKEYEKFKKISIPSVVKWLLDELRKLNKLLSKIKENNKKNLVL